ncbi:hypothetical protein [Pseudonocardia humida]|uniref:Uncharacterized protein n=1 Tax=Pseudonocardia humida TaxID=2800819 RepID=A0ABT1ACP5_9PSEU|nr:hypothetical protein [Pseudonocardia humida]MCO1660693.1 hypothetical protein [Pseudonocardia humida]
MVLVLVLDRWDQPELAVAPAVVVPVDVLRVRIGWWMLAADEKRGVAVDRHEVGARRRAGPACCRGGDEFSLWGGSSPTNGRAAPG